jgi:hypothetical protein
MAAKKPAAKKPAAKKPAAAASSQPSTGPDPVVDPRTHRFVLPDELTDADMPARPVREAE